MIKIALDMMGSDQGSTVACEAVKRFVNDYKDAQIYVVGKKEELLELENCATIIDAKDVITMEEGALSVMRKKESSMFKAIDLVAQKEVQGVVSAGSTGAYLSLATIKLKLLEGIERAGLITPLPTINNRPVLVLDVGANNENSPIHLLHFAKLGKVFSSCLYQVKQPKIYLLSNGTEEKKGSPLVKEAHQLLKENEQLFCGNIEAREVMMGNADVVVCDGYSGNILIKSIEGCGKLFLSVLKNTLTSSFKNKIGALLIKKSLKNKLKNLDYKQYGGAILAGVNGLVIKTHGNSDEQGYYNGLKMCYEALKNNIMEKIKENING